MNFVDFVINCYNAYHLTCNSSLFASCTHYTSYSLLNIVHVIVCVFRFDQPSLKLLWVLFVQNILCVWVFKGRMVENLNFGKTGFKTCVLKKHFISYSCIFISYIQCFKVCFQKLGYFSKKMFFHIFDWSNLFFDQSKSFLRILVSLCLVRLIEIVFRSIEHCESGFLKMDLDFFKSNFFKSFSSFLSLSDSDLAPPQSFVVFDLSFCKVSLSKHR